MATGPKAILVDTTKCIACRGCQVACKMWNYLPAEATTFFAGPGYQNPADVSFNTFTLIRFFTEIDGYGVPKDGEDVDGDGNWNFLRFACMHCTEPVCVTLCELYGAGLDTAMTVDTATGFVYIDQTKCVGCNMCTLGNGPYTGCPFNVPRNGTDPNPPHGPKNRKCTGCVAAPQTGPPQARVGNTYPATANSGSDTIAGDSLRTTAFGQNADDLVPACVTACPSGALQYGDRGLIITEAYARKAAALAKFPEANVYGDTDLDVQIPTQLNVISVLTRLPSFYGLPSPL